VREKNLTAKNAKYAEVAKECEAEETQNPKFETNPNDQKHKIQNNLVSNFDR